MPADVLINSREDLKVQKDKIRLQRFLRSAVIFPQIRASVGVLCISGLRFAVPFCLSLKIAGEFYR